MTIATTALVGSCAAAAFVNQLLLIPRFLRRERYGPYVAWLGVTMLALTAVALAVIRLFYIKILGPFPVKPWYVDHGLDLAGMIAHVLAAAIVVWAFGKFQRDGVLPNHDQPR